MRAIVVAGSAISMLLVGVWAISEQAQLFNPDGNTSSAANATHDVSTSLFDGVLASGGSGIVWFLVAATVLIAIGLLSGMGGGR